MVYVGVDHIAEDVHVVEHIRVSLVHAVAAHLTEPKTGETTNEQNKTPA